MSQQEYSFRLEALKNHLESLNIDKEHLMNRGSKSLINAHHVDAIGIRFMQLGLLCS